MAYSDWKELSVSQQTTLPESAFSPTGFPLDYRTLQETKVAVFALAKSKRHPGLRAYVVEDGIEYIYTAKTEDGLVSFPHDYIKEYHPELAHNKAVDLSDLPVKTYDENDEPLEYYTEEEILANPTLLFGNGAVTYSNKTYGTIPEGAEGTLKTSSGAYYKFIWNGSSWVTFANSGSSSSSTTILSFSTSDHVDPEDDTSATLTSINELTSALVADKYGSTPEDGTEANVIFTDDNDLQTFRKYIYLNGSWSIVRGSKSYELSLPSYGESWDDWTGLTEEQQTALPSGVSVEKVSSSTGTVNVFISHDFDSQFVDAFVFTKGTTDIDGDETSDDYGERILASVTCFVSSSNNNAYMVKIPLPISSATTTNYAITLQK